MHQFACGAALGWKPSRVARGRRRTRGEPPKPLALLAELRRREGRLVEATALFDQVQPHGLALLGRAELAFDRGDPGAAAELAARYLRQAHDENQTDRASGLELLVRSLAGLGGRAARSSRLEPRSRWDADGARSGHLGASPTSSMAITSCLGPSLNGRSRRRFSRLLLQSLLSKTESQLLNGIRGGAAAEVRDNPQGAHKGQRGAIWLAIPQSNIIQTGKALAVGGTI